MADDYAEDLEARAWEAEVYFDSLGAASSLTDAELIEMQESAGEMGLDEGSAIAADLLPRAFGQAGEFLGDVFSGGRGGFSAL